MSSFIVEIFTNYSRVIIFLHVMSAVLLVGSLFFIRFLFAPVLDKIEQDDIRYEAYLNLIKYFFLFITIVMIALVAFSIFMSVGLGLKFGDQTTYTVTHTKKIVWLMMILIFIAMYVKYRGAKRAMSSGVMVEVHENIILIVKYLIPANFILSCISVYFGIIIRGF